MEWWQLYASERKIKSDLYHVSTTKFHLIRKLKVKDNNKLLGDNLEEYLHEFLIWNTLIRQQKVLNIKYE